MTVFLMSYISTFAQNAGLYVSNNTPCNVQITMYAIANPTTGDYCFDLIGNPVVIPALGGVNSWGINSFDTYPGWAIATYPVTSASADFQWSSVHFTFSGCPTGWGCTPAGGNMGDLSYGCTSTSTSFSGGCGGHTVSGTWTTTNTILADVTIAFF